MPYDTANARTMITPMRMYFVRDSSRTRHQRQLLPSPEDRVFRPALSLPVFCLGYPYDRSRSRLLSVVSCRAYRGDKVVYRDLLGIEGDLGVS